MARSGASPGAWALLALAALLAAAPATALYEKGGPVISVTHRSFDKVTESKVPVVVVSAADRPGFLSSRPAAPLLLAAAQRNQHVSQGDWLRMQQADQRTLPASGGRRHCRRS